MNSRNALSALSKQVRVVPGTRRMQSSEVQALQVHHDKENMEFYIKLGDDKAFLQYDFIDQAKGTVDLQHTVVPDAFRGQGIAKVLAKTVMDHFATQSKQMKLTCWYLKKYYKENPTELYESTVIDV